MYSAAVTACRYSIGKIWKKCNGNLDTAGSRTACVGGEIGGEENIMIDAEEMYIFLLKCCVWGIMFIIGWITAEKK